MTKLLRRNCSRADRAFFPTTGIIRIVVFQTLTRSASESAVRTSSTPLMRGDHSFGIHCSGRTDVDWTAFWLTMQLATSTTLILFVTGLPLAYWLAMTSWRGRFLIEAVVALPLVLPPTVLGFYLLVALGPQSGFGHLYETIMGRRIPFSFAGILVGSVLFNLPFAIRPFTAAFAGMDRKLIEASWCLGISRWETFRRVTFPLCWPGILAGLIMAFAHTVGEFGVVLMIGGNIAGVTRTLSISIYDDMQALDYLRAGQTAQWLLVFSFCILCLTQWLSRRGDPV